METKIIMILVEEPNGRCCSEYGSTFAVWLG